MATRNSARVNKRSVKSVDRLIDRQSEDLIISRQKQIAEKEEAAKRRAALRLVQAKINEAAKKEAEKRAANKKVVVAKKSSDKATTTKSKSKSATGKGGKSGGKSAKAVKSAKTVKSATGKKGKKTASSGSISAPTFTSVPAFASFGLPSASPSGQPPKTIASKTEVNLIDYSYGVDSGCANQLDLVFCLDCTASMGSVIKSCQESIVTMVNTLISSEGQDVRFCLIPYRDHHSNEEYCTKVYPFTRDTAQMLKNVNGQSAGGGGDGPEAVTAALFEAVCLDWRESAAKLVVIMADAGPHGIEDSGDTFPNGDPDGKDPLSIAKEMVSLGITLYSILATGGWARVTPRSQDFFAGVSTITGGQCLNLADTALLSTAIISGARENIDIESSMAAVRSQLDEAAKTKGSKLTEDEASAITSAVIGGGGRKPRSLPDDKLIKISLEKFGDMTSSSTIVELKNKWRSAPASSSSSAGFAAPPTETLSSRVARMAVARDSRSTDPVMVECVAEGSKVRAKVISAGYDSSKNCQFPRDLRAPGKRFMVDTVIDAGSFYRVKGNIVPV
jgi:hypothetical protein